MKIVVHNLYSQYIPSSVVIFRNVQPIILAHINTSHYFLKGRFAVQIYSPNKFEKHGSGVSLKPFPIAKK